MPEPARVAGALVAALHEAVKYGQGQIAAVPDLVKKVIREDAWRKYSLPHSPTVVHTYPTFQAFVEDWLHITVGDLEAICKGRGDMEALSLLTEVTKNREGRPTVDNINSLARPAGTSSTYALRRLRKDREDLHAKVTNGEMTTNAAMVEAGFRQKQITIMLDPARAARTINRHFDKAQRRQLIELIESPTDMNHNG